MNSSAARPNRHNNLLKPDSLSKQHIFNLCHNNVALGVHALQANDLVLDPRRRLRSSSLS